MAETNIMNISINILPPELLVKILKLLKYKELCQAQLICRRWNEIIGKIKKKVAGKFPSSDGSMNSSSLKAIFTISQNHITLQF